MTKIPVFPLEVIRPIENALIGARTTAFAANQDSFQRQQQLLARGRPPPPHRDTPTPPNARPGGMDSRLCQPRFRPKAEAANGMQHGGDPAAAAPQSYPIHNNVSQHASVSNPAGWC